MTKLALTDLSIRRLLPADTRPTYYWDTHTTGLGVRVTRTAKAFVVLVGSGKRTTIGRYPIISLGEARTEAKRILAEKTLGKRVAPSLEFETIRERFLAACAEKNRPRTVADYTRLLRHFPFKGKIGNVLKHHVVERLDKIKAPSERAHALVSIKIFFRWAERQGYVEASPCVSLKAAQPPGQREHVLTDSELRRVWNKAAETPWPFGPIIQLLILTGQRRGEISLLRWEWLDEKEKLITLPGTTTKNRRTTTIPFGDLTAAVFAQLPRINGYLFPAAKTQVRGRTTTVFNGWSKEKNRFDRAVEDDQRDGDEVVAPWTIHDLRRTFATSLAALGIPVHVTEKLLNHVSGTISGVTAIYNRHTYMEEMRSAIKAWEARLQILVKGPDGA